ncbi:exocrine gland-secreted peptide 1-like [Apodemus sylvaticus]|uniref:exocrine gland-secreted peptide 1-like n=1 Tax=Apodemus sylvaticus TaxID=10129 RepID=UPI002243C7BA|nr:exocrine gland-secreted peptide 1-like [Apodemus sylvaticus]
MASFPVMCFLTILLLPSMLTEELVLKRTQKEPTISTDLLTLLIACEDLGNGIRWGLLSCQFSF